MKPENDLENELGTLSRKWSEITDVPETPRPVMDVIEYSLGSQRKAEVYANRLLRYFVDPDEPHGMGDGFLKAFLDGLPDELGFDEDTYDLSDVRVDNQVYLQRANQDGEKASAGEVDLVIESPNGWFLMVELKFSAGENNVRGEGLSQTENYYEATHIDGRPKDEYESGGYYLYLHQHDESSAEEDEFSNWTWKGLRNEVLEEFIVEKSPRYPQRTVVQLREFVDDLQGITGMTERQENEREKIELYLEHYDAIKDVSDTFDERWEEFAYSWKDRLADRLEQSQSDTKINLPTRVAEYVEGSRTDIDDYTAVETGTQELWLFRARNPDWGILYKEGWWRETVDMKPIYEREENQAWLGFHHRPERNRGRAIGDGELVLYLRNMSNSDQSFRDSFNQEFYSREDEIVRALPEKSELTGNKGDMMRAIYDIRVDAHDDFFEAYTDALHRAFVDHAQNPELIELIDEVYNEAVDEVYR